MDQLQSEQPARFLYKRKLPGGGQDRALDIGEDDQFLSSIHDFTDQMETPALRPKQEEAIRRQSSLMQELLKAAGKEGTS